MDGNKIVNKGDTVNEVTKTLVKDISDADSEVLTLYYGSEVSEEQAEDLAEDLRKTYPDMEVDVHYGGKPLYYYIFSLE